MDGEIKYNELKKLMDDLGREFVEELKKNLNEHNKIATGALVDSLNYRLVDKDNGFVVEIISDNYLEYVDKGRRPGKMPPSNKLIPWVEAKGIKLMSKGKQMNEDQVAFLIARSIGKKGIKPTNIIEETRKYIMAKYQSKIKTSIGLDYMSYIKNILIV